MAVTWTGPDDEVTLTAGDLEIGAVEIKNATTDDRVSVAIDEAAMPATPGVMAIGSEYRASATTYTDGDAAVLQSDISGHLKVAGYVADDSAQAATPGMVNVGGEYRLADTTYTDGDAAILQTTVSGYLKTGGYDSSNDLVKTQDQSPQWGRYTDAVALIAAAQDLTSGFVDVGGEIDCRGYMILRIFLTIDINSSQGVYFKVLGKHTSAGAGEFVYDPQKWALRDSSLSSAGDNRKLNRDADDTYVLEIELDNATPYIQLQAGNLDLVSAPAAQVDDANYVLGY